jgi:hypothetical protein
MQDFIDAVMFGFKEIVARETMKLAMLIGMAVTLVWVFIAYSSWDILISLSSSTLSFLPFSMLRSNGAWMLSTLLWLQLVLVTFALLFGFFGNMMLEKMDKAKYASFSLWIGILSALLWTLVWFFNGDAIYAGFLKLLTWLPFETIEKGISYLIAFYLVYSAIIVTLIFVTSLSSLFFLKKLRNKHFPYDGMNDNYELQTVKKTLRDTLIFLLASLVSFPLLFVPVINFLILVLLWIWLMKDTISSDTALFVFGEGYQEKKEEYKGALWALSFVGSLFNFIPILNLFGPYFTQSAMYYYLNEKRNQG